MKNAISWIISFVFTAFLLVLACAGIASCAAPARVVVTRAPTIPTKAVDVAVATSVRIVVFCNGEPDSAGSGVVVSDRQVLTARHIANACDNSKTPDMEQFVAYLPSGEKYELARDVGAVASDVDAYRLSVVGVRRFKAWASVRVTPPTVGEDVFSYAGDSGVIYPAIRFHFKPSIVDSVASKHFIMSAHYVGGNSGGAVFDADGRVVGIVVSRPNPLKPELTEFFGGAVPARAWLDLVP